MTTASGTGQPGPHGLSPMTPANPSATQKSPTGSQSRPAESTAASVSVADRYSALKELDEIFKTTVTVSDGQSTGASIFGSSPLATQPAVVDPSPIMNTGSVFGPSPTNFSSPITTSNLGAQENNGFESTAFATAWGSEAAKSVHQSQPLKPQMQVQAPAAVAAVAANENRGFSPSWTPNWGPSAATVANNTNITISSVASNNSSASKAPINPFTGASNLTQLNTSPWPTTGTSPVQNNSTSAWPNMGSNNASSGFGPSAPAAATSVSGVPFPATAAPPPTTNSGFPGFGLNSSNTTTPVAFPVPNNDPFGAAPATNIQKTAFAMDPFDWAGAKF